MIAVLSSIVLVATSEFRAAARDNQRMTDLKKLQLALEVYKSVNGVYPPGCQGDPTEWNGTNDGNSSKHSRECNSPNDDYIVGLAPTYIPELPEDPRVPPGDGIGFQYISDGESYKLGVLQTVESKKISSVTEEFARCPADDRCLTVGPPSDLGKFCRTPRMGQTSENILFTQSYAVWSGTRYQCQ